ncbi:peptidase [Streptomyces sp. TRM 70361]|uniref:peptidase n=1 Tax=Streptomyces sp. TRM 70361 TaxID=3116553 RepID=UPI002E7B1F2A|nr:peptidase [Streptomyces sp. TRM 70361]MEE1942039.1 peptidase [Streptomyces sp. TRM 70361]
MHSRTSSRSPAGEGPQGGHPLSPELASALSSARRRAGRGGDRYVDTAHLLHGLLESDPAVRGSLGGPARLTRVLGYLAQRSIGYGLRWQRAAEGAGRRAARHGAADGTGSTPDGHGRGPSGWSPAAVAALEDALGRARARGGARAEGVDLLDALVADPCCRAVEVLRRAGAPPVAPPAPSAVEPVCQECSC